MTSPLKDRILEHIRAEMEPCRPVALFCDFDGTLSAIAQTPSNAVLDPGLRPVLSRLSAEPGVILAIVSGRAIDDLKGRVGLPVIYAGNHGLEIRGPGFEYSVEGAEERRHRLLAVCNDLRVRLARIPGALVESKRLTASVHYRQVREDDIPVIREAVKKAVWIHPDFEMREGKKVYEIRPCLDWDKGAAVRWILDRVAPGGATAICLGDDLTDEDMFCELPDAVNIKVGHGGFSSAKYSICDSDLFEMLTSVLETVRMVRLEQRTEQCVA